MSGKFLVCWSSIWNLPQYIACLSSGTIPGTPSHSSSLRPIWQDCGSFTHPSILVIVLSFIQPVTHLSICRQNCSPHAINKRSTAYRRWCVLFSFWISCFTDRRLQAHELVLNSTQVDSRVGKYFVRRHHNGWMGGDGAGWRLGDLIASSTHLRKLIIIRWCGVTRLIRMLTGYLIVFLVSSFLFAFSSFAIPLSLAAPTKFWAIDPVWPLHRILSLLPPPPHHHHHRRRRIAIIINIINYVSIISVQALRHWSRATDVVEVQLVPLVDFAECSSSISEPLNCFCSFVISCPRSKSV